MHVLSSSFLTAKPHIHVKTLVAYVLVTYLAFALFVSSASAQTAQPQATPPQATQAQAVAPQEIQPQAALNTQEEATVVVYNRDVVTLRATVLGGTPSERAELITGRINTLLKNLDKPTVNVVPNSLGAIVEIDGNLGFLLTPEDANKLKGETLESISANAKTNLEEIIIASNESRNSSRIIQAITIAGIATLVMLTLFWLLNRIKRYFDAKLLNITNKKKLTVFGAEVFSRKRLIRVFKNITRSIYWLIAFLLTYEWLIICFEQFPYTRPWGAKLNEFLFALLFKIVNEVILYAPHFATAVAIFLIARYITSVVKSFFERVQSGEAVYQFLDPELAGPTRKIINICVWIFALVMAYPYLPGSDSEAFKGISVLIGLMISLGATNIIGQGTSGMIITFSRTFRVGEYVRIGDNEGTVTELGMFTTRLRTGMGEEISLSNSMVFGAITKNYSRAVPGSGYILDTVVTIGYDTPWRQVEAMLLEAAERTDGITKEYAPRVFQTALSDFYPEYRLVCYASPEKPLPRAVALSALHANIQDVFNEYGVQIMSPHYVGDPNQEKIVSADRKYLAPAKPSE